MMIKTTPPRFGQKGFTLIEIVMVLVLLGILAAVAVPKYFDLQEEAEKAAAKAIGAEYLAFMQGSFAEIILSGETCTYAKDWLRDVAMGDFLKQNKGRGFSVTGTGYVADETGKNFKSFELYINLHPERGWNYNKLPHVKVYMPECH